jgi:fused signal recognition particle receptor
MAFWNRNKTEEPKKSEPREGWLTRLGGKLGKTKQSFSRGLGDLLLGKRELDANLLEELETLLLTADVGIEVTQSVLDTITDRIGRKELRDTHAVYRTLRQILFDTLAPSSKPLTIRAENRPFVIMVVGVNGAGKTTTIGKLAHKFQDEGHSVMLAAGDTFRAAAVEQLQVWGARNNVPVISQAAGADAAAVAHDGLRAAMARRSDALLLDTAGRLHTQSGLMDELKKIKRVLTKVESTAPHEVLLVLDAGNGQNALAQLEHFRAAVGVTGLCLTKLDGTAKGGILFAIAKKTGLPIRYIGIGEGVEDLREFDAHDFVDALLPPEIDA